MVLVAFSCSYKVNFFGNVFLLSMNMLPIIPLYCNTKRVRVWISRNLYIIPIPLFISIYFSIKNSSTQAQQVTIIRKIELFD